MNIWTVLKGKLPDRHRCFSLLKDQIISEKDYLTPIDVWNTFKIKTMSDYHDLRLRTDVLLLADVFENFNNTCLKYYRLDLCHYFRYPGSWDAMLKMTGIELELISDTDIHLFIEKGMKRGISYTYLAKRNNKANNKCMQSDDVNKPSKFITNLDANDSYDWAMSQYLPYGGFKWLSQKEIDRLEVNAVGKNSLIGYILEVDLKYPDEFHELHNDYPLAPEKPEISHDMLSSYCSNTTGKHAIKINDANKLVPNLGKKSKFVLHYRNLQLYLS